MKFDKFLASYTKTDNNNSYAKLYEDIGLSVLSNLPELSSIIKKFSGNIFDNGLFKVHNAGSFFFWTNLTFEFFKKFKGNSYVFAFDWVGRQYAINYSENKTKILMLDSATGEAFELPKSLETFFNEDLINYKNDLLEFDKFNLLTQTLFNQLSFDQCCGFKIPLFLSGKDQIDNLEVIDLEVYWELNFQIYSKIKNLPGGTLIGNISIK